MSFGKRGDELKKVGDRYSRGSLRDVSTYSKARNLYAQKACVNQFTFAYTVGSWMQLLCLSRHFGIASITSVLHHIWSREKRVGATGFAVDAT